jgi:hypothetical protein
MGKGYPPLSPEAWARYIEPKTPSWAATWPCRFCRPPSRGVRNRLAQFEREAKVLARRTLPSSTWLLTPSVSAILRMFVKHCHCPGFDVAGLVAATRVSLPLTNTFMEFSVSPDSSVYS